MIGFCPKTILSHYLGPDAICVVILIYCEVLRFNCDFSLKETKVKS